MFIRKKTNKLAIPKFKIESQERAYREINDAIEHIDWSMAENVKFPNLRAITKTISLGLPKYLLDSITMAANARDVPYQSLINVWLQEKLHSH
jgi:hypothetical protein